METDVTGAAEGSRWVLDCMDISLAIDSHK